MSKNIENYSTIFFSISPRSVASREYKLIQAQSTKEQPKLLEDDPLLLPHAKVANIHIIKHNVMTYFCSSLIHKSLK